MIYLWAAWSLLNSTKVPTFNNLIGWWSYYPSPVAIAWRRESLLRCSGQLDRSTSGCCCLLHVLCISQLFDLADLALEWLMCVKLIVGELNLIPKMWGSVPKVFNPMIYRFLPRTHVQQVVWPSLCHFDYSVIHHHQHKSPHITDCRQYNRVPHPPTRWA